MVQPRLWCVQRVSSCWGTMLLGVRESHAAPGSCRVVVSGAAAPCCRMIHNDRHSTQRPPSHYDILKISPHATQDQIKKAYYKMSLEHHPDLHGGSVEASQKFRDISEAYEVLGDPLKRSNYDAVYGVYTPASSGRDVPPEATFRRRRRPDKSKFNMDAWEEAHYGSAGARQPPDWRRTHNPHRFWGHHGPRPLPYDAARFWDQEMARKYGGQKAAEFQRRMMEERVRELHRTGLVVLVLFFFFATLVNVSFDDRPKRFPPRIRQEVDKNRD